MDEAKTKIHNNKALKANTSKYCQEMQEMSGNEKPTYDKIYIRHCLNELNKIHQLFELSSLPSKCLIGPQEKPIIA
jgi:hypothetical protein